MRAAVLLEQRLQPNLTPDRWYWPDATIEHWEACRNIVWGITAGAGYVPMKDYYNPDGTLKSVAEWTRNAY